MKSKKIIMLVAITVMMCIFAITASAGTAKTIVKLQISSPHMTVNGIKSEIDPGRDTVPLVENGRTLVPIRAIIEAFGGSVGWDGEKSEVSLTYKDDIINLTIGSDAAYFNGEKSTLDVTPKTINGRTMLPIRFIAESFNFKVDWDGATSTVTITQSYGIKSESTSDMSVSTPENDFDVFENPEEMTEEFEEESHEIHPDDEELNPEDEEDFNAEYEEELLSEM